MFANRKEFTDEVTTASFLDEAREKGNKYLLDRLISWTDALIHKYKKQDGDVHCKAYTVAELAKQVEPFTQTVITLEGEPPRASPWPLVEIVR